MEAIIIETPCEGYSLNQVRTMTVGELIEILSNFEPETKIYTSHDNGYTFGGIHECNIECNIEEKEYKEEY